jgi:ubiquinone/menaquinone biosynthesis C-methylase UbiE/uncharacterized protein YbaR (Trm112 family)
MRNLLNRPAQFVAQVLFSIITPPLLMPKIAKLSITRFFISFCFGRMYGNRYQDIIDAFQGRYGLAMAKGLAKAKEIAGNTISVIVDCGTGTGFVTKQAVEEFPHATFIAFDLLPGMLTQARNNCKDIPADIFHVQADTFALPLADESADLVLVQNTIPCFSEFARVCRPGGMVIFVDTSAGWIADLAKRLVEKHKLFETVIAERVDSGFFVLSRKAGDEKPSSEFFIAGQTKQQKLLSLLRCPIDKSNVVVNQSHLCCQQHHRYPIHDGFPVMLKKCNIRS